MESHEMSTYSLDLNLIKQRLQEAKQEIDTSKGIISSFDSGLKDDRLRELKIHPLKENAFKGWEAVSNIVNHIHISVIDTNASISVSEVSWIEKQISDIQRTLEEVNSQAKDVTAHVESRVRVESSTESNGDLYQLLEIESIQHNTTQNLSSAPESSASVEHIPLSETQMSSPSLHSRLKRALSAALPSSPFRG
ncbi:hypothetical protein VNI00_004491 [Paramarasmius palmivorus]|uniref:Uncharacterized protein n=1 Tax=Paramarasmius palmivorus TaxID=297713 RepID=A0AAW0DI07_9AGAR